MFYAIKSHPALCYSKLVDPENKDKDKIGKILRFVATVDVVNIKNSDESEMRGDTWCND